MNFIRPLLVMLTLLLNPLALRFKYRHSSVCILQMLFPYNSAFRKDKVTESTATGKPPGEGASLLDTERRDMCSLSLLPLGHPVLGWQCQKNANLSAAKSTFWDKGQWSDRCLKGKCMLSQNCPFLCAPSQNKSLSITKTKSCFYSWKKNKQK